MSKKICPFCGSAEVHTDFNGAHKCSKCWSFFSTRTPVTVDDVIERMEEEFPISFQLDDRLWLKKLGIAS